MRGLAIVLAVVFLIISGCGNREDIESAVPEIGTDELHISVLDVGKADAIVLSNGDETVVIDTGEKGNNKDIEEYLDKKGLSRIDYLIITHFDKDHVGGAAKLIKNVEIGQIITPDYTGNNKEYEKFVDAVVEAGLEWNAITQNISFSIGDANITIYPPMKTEYKSEPDNDYSLVIDAEHCGNSFMFAGDCMTERLAELPEQMNMEHDFLKVPHHGRECEGMYEFIKSVSPDYAVITCSEKEGAEFGVIDALGDVGCMTYMTTKGRVDIISSPGGLTVEQDKE